jgi:thioredoxin reductase
MEPRPFDVIIIGGGPAGLSAALVLGRARRSVLVVDDGEPRNAVAEQMHGFLTRDGTPPAEMARIARDEIAQYPSVTFLAAHVARADDTPAGFLVTTATGDERIGRRLLITTGVFDALPALDGLPERWGRSVFVCPFCDGWEVQERRIAVSGRGREAVELAQELSGWTRDLVVAPDRDDLTAADHAWIAGSGSTLHVGELQRLIGPDGTLERIAFADGAEIACDVLFISAPLRQHSPLFRSLGCELTPDGAIAVDACAQTTHRGCYAAGDSVTSLHQVIVAAASGVRAAISIANDLLADEIAAAAKRVLDQPQRWQTTV